MTTIHEFTDASGQLRRCGSLPRPAGLKSSFPVFENSFPVWSDAEIRAALTHPDRRVARKVFGPEWIPNQGQWGSCNGFAAANAYGRARYLGGMGDGVQYSGSWTYSLINGGRDNGSMLDDGMEAAMNVGFVPASECPPSAIYPHLQKPGLKTLAAKNKAVECFEVTTMQGLRTAGAAGHMMIVAVQAGNGFMRLDGRGISGVDRGQGNHAVTLDDMLILDDGPEVFDCIMDWGTQVGDQGKTYLTAQHFAQTIGVHAFYALPIGQGT